MITSYRGPMKDRLLFDGKLTDEHYVAVTAKKSLDHLFHGSSSHILQICQDVDSAIVEADRLADDECYGFVAVHVLARGWGYPDICSRVYRVEATEEESKNRARTDVRKRIDRVSCYGFKPVCGRLDGYRECKRNSGANAKAIQASRSMYLS